MKGLDSLNEFRRKYNLIEDRLKLVAHGYPNDFSKKRKEGYILVLLQSNLIPQDEVTESQLFGKLSSKGYLGYQIQDSTLGNDMAIYTSCNLDEECFVYEPGINVINTDQCSGAIIKDYLTRAIRFGDDYNSYNSRKEKGDPKIKKLLIDVINGNMKIGDTVSKDIEIYLHQLFKK